MSFKKLLTSGKVWITSDTHFGHKNIVRGATNWRTQDGEVPVESTRDFQTIEQMNELRKLAKLKNSIKLDFKKAAIGALSQTFK